MTSAARSWERLQSNIRVITKKGCRIRQPIFVLLRATQMLQDNSHALAVVSFSASLFIYE
jgi:hypothetical protein